MNLISAQDCLEKLKSEAWQLIDIREDYELKLVPCHLSAHLVMGDVLLKLDFFKPGKHYILMCKTGKRAGSLAQLLKTKVQNCHFYAVDGGVYEMMKAQDLPFDEY